MYMLKESLFAHNIYELRLFSEQEQNNRGYLKRLLIMVVHKFFIFFQTDAF